jgi:hypothetical protein
VDEPGGAKEPTDERDDGPDDDVNTESGLNQQEKMTTTEAPRPSPAVTSEPPPWKTVQSLPSDDLKDEGPSLVVEDREPAVTHPPKRDELQYEVIEDDWSNSDDDDASDYRASTIYH